MKPTKLVQQKVQMQYADEYYDSLEKKGWITHEDIYLLWQILPVQRRTDCISLYGNLSYIKFWQGK